MRNENVTIILIASGLFLLKPTPVRSKNAPTEIYLYENYKPFSYESSNKPSGLYYFITKKVFEKTNLSVSYTVIPFKRGLSLAKDGKGIIAGLLKTPEREKDFGLVFSESFYEETTLMYRLKEKDIKLSQSSPVTSLRPPPGGKRLVIGTNLGWTYGQEFNDARKSGDVFDTYEVQNEEMNFQKLVKKRIDLVIGNSFSSDLIIKRLGYKDQIIPLEKTIDIGKIYIAGTNQFSNEIDLFNKHLTAMKKSGELDLFIQKVLAEYSSGKIN